MLIIYKFQGFHAFSREGYPLKTPAKILPFFLIGVILLRN